MRESYLYNLDSIQQTGKKIWSWFAGAEKSGIYEVIWQQTDKLNRIALCLESCSVAVIDASRIPAFISAT